MSSTSGPPVLPCPVCGTALRAAAPSPEAATCPACGLPAAARAALVVARVDATMREFARDREALLAALRAAAPGPAAPPVPFSPAPPVAVPPAPVPPAPAPGPPAPPAWWPPAPELPVRPPRRRLSPQQVLLGLGALLLVAGALAFVALGWTRLGLVFQAGVMGTLTAAAAGASAWAARRGLRATEEALAGASAALLAVDLGAAHARGLLGVDEVPLRLWTAVACAVLVTAGLLLGRATRSTTTWPLVALLAGQPVPLLLLPGDRVSGAAGVAALLVVAAVDLAAVLVVRGALVRLAGSLAGLAALGGGCLGVATAGTAGAGEAWTATALLLAAAAAVVGVPLHRLPARLHPFLPAGALPLLATGTAALALALAASRAGTAGPVLAGAAGLAVLTAAALVAGPAHPWRTPDGGRSPVLVPALLTGGTVLALGVAARLWNGERTVPLALLVLAVAVPAAVAAVRLPEVRAAATATALLAPAAAVLVALAGDRLTGPTAGLLLALTAALAFGVGAVRAGAAEEPAAAAAGAVIAGAAAWASGGAGAWGQLGLQLAVVGVSAGAYALATRRQPVAALAVADLVTATWIAVGGAGVTTPEAYTLPAAVGLLLVALPALRRRGPSWAAEGAAVGVALVPSALVEVADPGALRLVLVVAAGVALTAVGTLARRQAPFVVGAGALAVVVLGRLGPYAPLLPRWLSLAAAGLVLLVLGATYERRRQQAREAVAWVSQLG
ncbi:hypothetical protein [Modestobacter sp. NPDC049651]|uniref:SCO7613 C-terminal domain-containing membrane protein n=1 Tax=unclassified Modestobacter TaxID=2643866 RepID=UPI0033FE9B5F